MRVLITTVQVPFVQGGAEIHAQGLKDALVAHGHEAEIVTVPFKWYPPKRILDAMLSCRLLDLSEVNGKKIDRLIGLKFPAYLIPHENKVLWVLHQHRTAYDLWDTGFNDLIHYPDGAEVRDAIRQADSKLIPEAKAVYANSANVAFRLKKYCGIDSTPLYHPPLGAEKFYAAAPEDYLYFPSRLNYMKRQALVLEALSRTRNPVRVRFSGIADTPEIDKELQALVFRLKLANRIEWLGHVTEEDKHDLYARCLAVIYPPVDEDFGYVSLEAMLSSKPVITCTDSGGTREFIVSEENGLIAEATPDRLAEAMDLIWENRDIARRWGVAARQRYETLDISWTNVVNALLS